MVALYLLKPQIPVTSEPGSQHLQNMIRLRTCYYSIATSIRGSLRTKLAQILAQEYVRRHKILNWDGDHMLSVENLGKG